MTVLTRHQARLARGRVTFAVARAALRQGAGLRGGLRLLRGFAGELATLRDPEAACRVARVGGRLFTHLHAPGWPSPAFDRHVAGELASLAATGRDRHSRGPGERLQTVIFAVTKACGLRCRHCCEWQELNRSETLTRDDITAIVAKFVDHGVTQMHFSGGEPLRRSADILAAVAAVGPVADYWLLTSGVGLDAGKARQLAAGGITGVNISLDHWRAEYHDAFRGSVGAFARATAAARAARAAGLVVCLTACADDAFVADDGLSRFVALALELGAHFVQVLEPRAVGRYAGQNVGLDTHARRQLARQALALNRRRDRRAWPLVTRPDADRRRVGCLGAGRRYLYVDTDGLVHPCPFCRGAVGRALTENVPTLLARLHRGGCRATSPTGPLVTLPQAENSAAPGIERRTG